MVDISKLKDHPRNYRDHPDDQLEHIMQSLREHGFYRNIVCAEDMTILAGHGVVKAAKKLGLTQAPVIKLPIDPEDARALKVLAGDNELSHLAIDDDRLLSELLKEIADTDVNGLLGTGYDEMMLANLVMVTRPESEIRNFDEAAAWVGMPEYGREAERLKLVMYFASDADREDFSKRLGLNLNEKSKSAWWPPREDDDVSSLKVVG